MARQEFSLLEFVITVGILIAGLVLTIQSSWQPESSLRLTMPSLRDAQPAAPPLSPRSGQTGKTQANPPLQPHVEQSASRDVSPSHLIAWREQTSPVSVYEQ